MTREVEERAEEVKEGVRLVKEETREVEGPMRSRSGPGRSRKGPMRSRSGPGRSRRGPGRPRRGGVKIDRVRDGQFWPVTKCSSRNMWMCFFYCILFYHITNILYELLLLKFCR